MEIGKHGTLTTPHPLAEETTLNRFWEDKANNEYKNMLKSVIDNKGFYIARYEASPNSDLTKAQSKRKSNGWTSVSQSNSITYAIKYNSMLHSHLIYGIEWDSVLEWLQGNAKISTTNSFETNKELKVMDKEDIQSNSSSWGNYSNSTGNAAINKNVLQTSGTSEYWKANNIYDLAGNLWELTQENLSNKWIVTRGGYYNCGANGYPVASRDRASETYISNIIGFRFSMYL